MIRDFNRYLQSMSGLDEAGVKARYGLPANQKFDAPSNDNRGGWDSYDDANPFFKQWYSYNRYN